MNSKLKHQKNKRKYLTKRQKRIFRKKQVRRRILLLIFVGIVLFLLIMLNLRNCSKPSPHKYTINQNCENYRPLVEETAAQYDMSDYVDLILAVMMQESSGEGSDVMQSAEGAYNTQYPQEPNGIPDPEYSISCGIQELKYAMEKADVQSPGDIEDIKLALQAYNFGADGYFSFMKEHGYTSWSEESAQEYACYACGGCERSEENSLRQTAGPYDYGDQRYPEHVLRYYPID